MVLAPSTHFYQINPFAYSINVFNFTKVSFVNTLLSVKYNEILEPPPHCLYESI